MTVRCNVLRLGKSLLIRLKTGIYETFCENFRISVDFSRLFSIMFIELIEKTLIVRIVSRFGILRIENGH